MFQCYQLMDIDHCYIWSRNIWYGKTHSEFLLFRLTFFNDFYLCQEIKLFGILITTRKYNNLPSLTNAFIARTLLIHIASPLILISKKVFFLPFFMILSLANIAITIVFHNPLTTWRCFVEAREYSNRFEGGGIRSSLMAIFGGASEWKTIET